MKKLSALFGLFLICSLFLNSCMNTVNINETPKKNFIKIGDKELPLADGMIANSKTSEEVGAGWEFDGYYQTLMFLTEGSSYVQDEGGDWDIEFEENLTEILFFDFNIFSSTKFELDSGNYTFSTQSHPEKSFSSGYIYIHNYEDDSTLRCEISGGSFTVSKSDNEYSITLDCTGSTVLTNGGNQTVKAENITAFFKGTLKYAAHFELV